MKSRDAMRLPGAGLVGLFLLVTELFLAARFVLHFFAANPHNGFAMWVFNSTDGMMTPFRHVFTQTVVGNPHYVDLQTLFVMAAYVVVAYIFAALLGWLHEVAVPEVPVVQAASSRKR